jgi:ribonuclease P protein component
VKRRIRESFRRAPERAQWRGDAVVIAKSGAGAVPSADLEQELLAILGRHLVATSARRR